MLVETQEALGRSAIYELASLAFLYPAAGTLELLTAKTEQAEQVDSPELANAFKQLAAELSLLDEATLLHEYVSVFGHSMASECSLYEEEYANSEIFMKSGSLADLKGFYAAFGVKPDPELKDRLDHVGVELEFMHLLTFKEAYARHHGHGPEKVAVCREAQVNFLKNHLAPLVKALARRLSQKTGGQGFYSSLGRLLDLQIDREMDLLGLEIPSPSRKRPTEPEEIDDECGAPPLQP
ncbi:MAG: hypothetical protein CMI32_03990 [Opitutales bacterium]|nr:hypothetical protein [Opitutales bacterium]